jgi:hypothetical protein
MDIHSERRELVGFERLTLHPGVSIPKALRIVKLSQSIMKYGQLQPARGRPKGDRIEVYIGGARFHACSLMRLPLDVIIAERTDVQVEEEMFQEKADSGSEHFFSPGADKTATFRADIHDVLVWARYSRKGDTLEFAESILEELEDWLTSDQGAIYEAIWVPETEAEMREFAAFAESLPGPSELYRRNYRRDPTRSAPLEGMPWEEFFNSSHREHSRTPHEFARDLVKVTREWDLPSWDRRHEPKAKPKPPRSLTIQAGVPEPRKEWHDRN